MAWSAPQACSDQATMGTMAMPINCHHSNADPHASMGKLCKVAAACSLTMPAFQASVIPASPYLRSGYPRIPAHFILQDFPQTLLRPPRLA